MPKMRANKTFVGKLGRIRSGTIFEVDTTLGNRYERRGLAEPISSSKKKSEPSIEEVEKKPDSKDEDPATYDTKVVESKPKSQKKDE